MFYLDVLPIGEPNTKVGHTFLAPLQKQQAYESVQRPADQMNIAFGRQNDFFPLSL